MLRGDDVTEAVCLSALDKLIWGCCLRIALEICAGQSFIQGLQVGKIWVAWRESDCSASNATLN